MQRGLTALDRDVVVDSFGQTGPTSPQDSVATPCAPTGRLAFGERDGMTQRSWARTRQGGHHCTKRLSRAVGCPGSLAVRGQPDSRIFKGSGQIWASSGICETPCRSLTRHARVVIRVRFSP